MGDQTVEGLPGVRSIIDEILIYGEGDTEEEAIADHDVKFRTLIIKYGTDFLWIWFKTFGRNYVSNKFDFFHFQRKFVFI
jgi:hypothetical protein